MKRLLLTFCLLVAVTGVHAETIVSGNLVVRDSGKLYFPDGSFQDKAQMIGPKGDTGPAGPANALTIGTVFTGNPGTAASAAITGQSPNQVLNFLIPQGQKGDKGDAGVQGPAGPPWPDAVRWSVVSGTAYQAVSNGSYLTTNVSRTTIDLPATPAAGDVVRLMASSRSGGWLVRAHSGQSLEAIWSPRESPRFWISVASSSDGTKLVAVTYRDQIYTSVDSGVTWTPRESARVWSSVASSSDGTKLVAVASGDQIFTSTDSGASWTPRKSARGWLSVASSSDGTKLVAVASGDQIFTSTDSGASWTPRESVRYWRSVASSSDGTKLVAVATGDQIFTSTDSGVTWTPRESARGWSSVASSSDGTKLVAVEHMSFFGGGRIYTFGTVNNILGSNRSGIDLLYDGSGEWLIVGSQGGITPQ